MSSRNSLIYFGGFNDIGGIESSVHDIIALLGADARTITLLYWGKRTNLTSAIEDRGVQMIRSCCKRGAKFLLPNLLMLIRGAPALLRARNIVFAKLPETPILCALALLLKLSAHNPSIRYITPYRPAEMWPLGMPAVARRLLHNIYTQTNEFAADLRRLGYPGQVTVVPLVPPPPTSTVIEFPYYNNARFRLGFLGRLAQQKNLSYLLEIVAIFGADELELHIFGSGPDLSALVSRARALQCRVTFHGELDRARVPDSIDSCDAFAFTSISEGQCLAALEILGRGRPIVATPVGAFPEILTTDLFGRLLPSRDALGAASQLRMLIGDIERRKYSPRQIVDEFSAKFCRSKIAAIYARLFSLPQA